MIEVYKLFIVHAAPSMGDVFTAKTINDNPRSYRKLATITPRIVNNGICTIGNSSQIWD